MLSLVVDHDVFRFQVAVDNAVGVDVFEGVENTDGDADGALLGDAAFVEDLAQQAALAPLHDHVDAGALLAAVDAHDLGVVEFFADAGFALKAVEEDGVGFQVGVGNFEGDDAVIPQVGGAVDGGHSAAGDRRLDAVGIDLRTGFKGVEKTHRAERAPFRHLLHFIGNGETVRNP